MPTVASRTFATRSSVRSISAGAAYELHLDLQALEGKPGVPVGRALVPPALDLRVAVRPAFLPHQPTA